MAVRTLLAAMLDAQDAACADAFLRDAPFPAYQQTRGWIGAAPAGARRGWRTFLCSVDGVPVGAAIVRYSRLAMGWSLATVQRGPIVHDAAHLPLVLAELKRMLKADRCCSVQLAPRVRGRALPDITEALRDAGFAPLPADQRSLHDTTGIIWLDKPEADILAGFKQRGRRAIRAAATGGITVRAVDGAADMATYQDLLDRFATARPDYDMSGQPDGAGHAALVAASGGALLLAEREGACIGAHAFVRQGDEAIWLAMATLDGKGPSAGYALLWDAMLRARDMGCVGYDLAGLPDGEPSDAGEAGRVQFKTAFAPHRRVMPPMQIAALAPVPHAVLFSARQVYRAWRARGTAHG